MTTQQMEFAPAAPGTDRLGQGTAVEQARAVAGVQAQVLVAWHRPRDIEQARARMQEACSHLELADVAFYSYPRGGETVSGETVRVAVELAMCWGNIDFGLTEMRRDDTYGQSEMLAFAWDMETNVRVAHTFFVQHVRTTRDKTYKLTDARDVYELNTNEGSRRMREAIFRVLPSWYKTEARKALRATLWKAIGAESIEEGVEKALDWYRSEFDIRKDQLEFKLRKPTGKWKADDLIDLRTLSASIKRGDLRLEDAFPSARVTRDELAEDARAPKAPRPAPRADAGQPSGEALPVEVGARVEILRPPADQPEITNATMYKGCIGTVAQPDANGPQDWFVRLDEVPERFPAWRGKELPFRTSELRVIAAAAATAEPGAGDVDA